MKLKVTEDHLNRALKEACGNQRCVLAQAASDVLGYMPSAGLVTFGDVLFEDNSGMVFDIENLFDHRENQPENVEKLRALLPVELHYKRMDRKNDTD